MGLNRTTLVGGRIGNDMVVKFGRKRRRKNTSFEIKSIANRIRVTRKRIIFEIKSIIIMLKSRLPWRYQT